MYARRTATYAAAVLIIVCAVRAHERVPNPFTDEQRHARDTSELDGMSNTLREFTSRLPPHQALALEMMPVAGMFGLLTLAVFCAGFWCTCCLAQEMCDTVHKPLFKCGSKACCWPFLCGRGLFHTTRHCCGRTLKWVPKIKIK